MARKKQTVERKLQKRILQNVCSKRNFLDKANNRAAKDQFIEKFVLCEIATKNVLSYYRKVNGKEKDVENIEMGLNTIKAALCHAQYDVDNEMLEKMFKAKKKRGERSARDLRNGIVHDLMIPDIQEVIRRKDELFNLMDRYLEIFTSSNL